MLSSRSDPRGNFPASLQRFETDAHATSFVLPEEIASVFWIRHWEIVLRHWRTIGLAALAGAVFGLLISIFQPNRYHAVTTIEVQGITDNVLRREDGNPNAGADAELSDLQTQVHVIQSAGLLAKALGRLSLEPGVAQSSTSNTHPIAIAVRSLRARAVPQTRIIEIGSDSPDPAVAARFVNAVAAEFIDQHMQSRWQGTERSAEKLRTALEDMRVRLEQSEDAAHNYARDSGILLTGDRGSVSEEKLRALQAELGRAQADRVVKESRLTALSAHSNAELNRSVDDPSVRAMEEKLTDLRRQLAELQTTYEPGYSKVRRLEAQIAPLESAIDKQITGLKERANTDFHEARHREELLDAAYRAQGQLVSSEGEKRIHYDVLRREVESTRTLYDMMLGRVKEAAISSAMRASNVRILDGAQPPRTPYQPRPVLLLLFGTLFGGIAGAAIASAREQTHHPIRQPGELHLCLDAPEWGAIPRSREAGLLSPSDTPALEESFRAILTSLLFSPNNDACRVLVVASAHAGEGKTTVTAHLAAALAQSGKNVLVMEGDLRSPRIHDVLGTANDIGLNELLHSEAPLEYSTLATALHTSRLVKGLAVLSAGSAADAAPHLLHGPRLKEIIEHARRNFEIVLIDSPPLLQAPDARVFGRVSDALVIVVQAEKTTREAVLAVRQKLADDGISIMGSILNHCNPKSTPGYFRYVKA